MLSPKRYKFRNVQRGKRNAVAYNKANTLEFGEFGLMSLEAKWISNRQIEAARIAMTRHIKRGGKVWIRIFPDKPYTKKPLETRQGNGKGPLEKWVANVKKGQMMFEMGGVDEKLASEAMELASAKLPIKTRFIARKETITE